MISSGRARWKSTSASMSPLSSSRSDSVPEALKNQTWS